VDATFHAWVPAVSSLLLRLTPALLLITLLLQQVDVVDWRRHFVEADVPEEKAGNSPGDLIQKAKASMRDSPFGLADLALPTLGALGSVALNDAHNWSCESLEWFVMWAAGMIRMEFRRGWGHANAGSTGQGSPERCTQLSCELWHFAQICWHGLV
jgi:hypothetical protein